MGKLAYIYEFDILLGVGKRGGESVTEEKRDFAVDAIIILLSIHY